MPEHKISYIISILSSPTLANTFSCVEFQSTSLGYVSNLLAKESRATYTNNGSMAFENTCRLNGTLRFGIRVYIPREAQPTALCDAQANLPTADSHVLRGSQNQSGLYRIPCQSIPKALLNTYLSRQQMHTPFPMLSNQPDIGLAHPAALGFT